MAGKIIIVLVLIIAAGAAGWYFYSFKPNRLTIDTLKQALAAEGRLKEQPVNDASKDTPQASTETPAAQPAPESNAPAPAAATASAYAALDTPPTGPDGGIPDVFYVKFECSNGDFVAEFRKDWAPLGAQRVYDLVRDGVWNSAKFFRVVPGFVVQWGIPADPAVGSKWTSQRMKDDPVKQSNTRGTISFAAAGPNTRTLQVFINFGDNKPLDTYEPGFAPVGKVVMGMDVVDKFNSKYKDQPTRKQGEIQRQGNAFLDASFPGLDYIKKASFAAPAAQ